MTSMILSIVGLCAFIAAALIKGENIKQNLFFVFTGSILIGTSYLFADSGMNGVVSSYVGAVQTFINYFYNKKQKKIPVWLILAYVLAFLCMNLTVLESAIGILALLASLCFVGCISAKDGKGYRFWQIINSLLWISYDILSKSYGPLVTHGILFVFTIVGVLINDYRTSEK